MITYAGVPLETPITQDLQDWLDKHYNLKYSTVWDEPLAGKNRYYYTVPGSEEPREIRLGSLYWPRGAGRWATGYYLASTNERDQIRAKVGASPTQAFPLVLNDGKRSITTNLWLLPFRPIADIPGQNGLFLMTLVDDRYYWWFNTPGFLDTHTGNTAWGNVAGSVITQIQTALQSITPGLTIAVDPIPAVYATASKNLTSRFESLPPTFDTAAYNCGHRVVRRLDGTVLVQSVANARLQLNKNLASLRPVEAGGFIAVDGVRPQDTAGVFPQAVRVTFPVFQDNVPLVVVNQVTVTLASLIQQNLTPELANVKTNAQTKTFHETGFAKVTSPNTWNNQQECINLATQIAIDWYRYQTANTNFVFAGIQPWVMEGLSDAVEWVHTDKTVHTRIHRPTFNDATEELLHATSAGSTDQYPTNSLLVRYSDNSLVFNTVQTISLDKTTLTLAAGLPNEIVVSAGGTGPPPSFNFPASSTTTWTGGGSGATTAVWNINGPLNVNVGSSVVWTFNGAVEYCGWAFDCCTSYTLASGSVNDLNLPANAANKVVYALTGPANPSIITGILPAQIGGVNGPQVIELVNAGSNPIQLNNQSASSSALNRIILPPTYGSSVTLAQNDTITLWYDLCSDAVNTRWKVLACTVDPDATSGSGNGLYALTGSATVANTTTTTSLLTAGGGTHVGTITIPANTIVAGQSYWIRVVGSGQLSSGTTTLTLSVGGVTFATGTITGSLSGYQWSWDGQITFQAAGASVGVSGDILFDLQTTGDTPSILVGGASGVNTTAAVNIDLTVAHSVAATGNTITATEGVITQTYPGTSGGGGGGSGTVTSVALSMPPEFSVSGSPITTAGTFTVNKGSQAANTVYAGPLSGAATAPTFRLLTVNDVPTSTALTAWLN